METGSQGKEFRNETGGVGLRADKAVLGKVGPATHSEEPEKCLRRGAQPQGSGDLERWWGRGD